MQNSSEIIKTLRENNGDSQTDLAQELNTHRGAISKMESGKLEPFASQVGILYRKYGISPFILCGINLPKGNQEKVKMIMNNCTKLIDSDLDILLRISETMIKDPNNKFNQ